MEKQVQIDGKKYQLIYKGLTNRIYRDTFGEDCLNRLHEMQWAINFSLQTMAQETENVDDYTRSVMLSKAVDNEFIERLVWASIKASKKNKKVPSPTDFVDNVEQYNALIDIGISWMLEILKAMNPTVEPEETEMEDAQDTKKLA